MKRILLHGKVYVEKDVFSEAVFIEDGIIKAVGSNDDILGMADGETELTDCGGKTLIPGLNDSHMHSCSWERRATRRTSTAYRPLTK